MLARIIRVEADVKHSAVTPKTVDEALAELESKVGTKGRRKFEKFLREVAQDEDEDVVDVELKQGYLLAAYRRSNKRSRGDR